MATQVYMKSPSTNLTAKAYLGFSWTALFFGPWPLLFRGEWGFFLIFLAVDAVVGFFTLGVGSIVLQLVWAFIFNKWHMRRLIERGYAIDASQSDALVSMAKAAVGIAG